MKKLKWFILILAVTAVPSVSLANHGPGTSGGGANTQSGETLKEGQFVLSVDQIYTNYENLSQDNLEAHAVRSGGFDALSDAFLTSLTVSYGVTNDFQIDTGLGWYSGRDFVQVHPPGGEVEKGGDGEGGAEEEAGVGRANPEGLTDLMVRARYRVMKGQPGHLSVIAGAVLPTGRSDVFLSSGDRLEPSSQPGTGRQSALGGLAYSRFLAPRVTLDASWLYTRRFERDSFRVGSRSDTGIAVAYRLNDSVASGPQFAPFLELTHQYIGRDRESGSDNLNSGGNTLFVTPGVRLGVSKDLGIVIAPSFPVAQDLNGEQLETDFRLTTSVFARF